MLRSLVIKHVCHWDEPIGLLPFDVHPEDSGADHHSDLGEVFERVLLELRHLIADGVVVSFDVVDLLLDLLEEGRALQLLLLLLGEEDGEVLERLWEDVDEGEEVTVLSSFLLLEDVGRQEGVFR